jgi:hypothetical protein
MAEKVRPGVDGLHFRRGSPHDLARTLRQAAERTVFETLAGTLGDSVGGAAFLASLLEAFDGGPRTA